MNMKRPSLSPLSHTSQSFSLPINNCKLASSEVQGKEVSSQNPFANKINYNGPKRGYKNCPTCLKGISEKIYAAHLASHDPTKFKSCPHCSFMAFRSNSIAAHVRREHLDVEMAIFACPLPSISSRCLRSHEASMNTLALDRSQGNNIDSTPTFSSKQLSKKKNPFGFQPTQIMLFVPKMKNKWDVFKSLGVFKCDLCPTEFTSWKSLCLHKLEHLKIKRLHCKSCSYATHHPQSMKAHMQLQHVNKKAERKPLKSVTRVTEVKGPSQQQTNSSLRHDWLCCSYCDYKSQRYDFFKIHVKRAHDEGESEPLVKPNRPVNKKPCSKGRQYSPHHSKKWLRCKFCDYVSQRQDYMKHHLQAVHFSIADDLKIPTKTQLMKKDKKECPTCKMVINKKTFYIHSRAHDPSKWLHCDYCEYTTVDRANLKRHLAIHSNSSTWSSCPHCKYSTPHVGNIKPHIRNMHPEMYRPKLDQRESNDDVTPDWSNSVSRCSSSSSCLSLDFSAIRKHLSAIIPSRANASVS